MEIARQIRVLLEDDQTMLRQALRTALEAYPNIQVVGEASDGEEAVSSVSKLQPTVVVMDINMSKMDGITATRLIKVQNPNITVVGLSVNPKDYQLYAMQKAGAFEVLKKHDAVNDLYGAIQRAVAAIQPVLILEDTSIPKESAGHSEQAGIPDSAQRPIKEPKI